MTPRWISVLAGCLAAAVAAVLPCGAAARAETHEAATVALGWQAEAADTVVVGRVVGEALADPEDPAAGRTVEVRIDRTLKGTRSVGESVTVRFADHGRSVPWQPLLPHLLFLRTAGTSPEALPAGGVTAPAFAPVCGSFSVRALAPGTAEAGFPDRVAAYLEAAGRPDARGLRALLVAWMDDADAGVAWSAATDFVRRTDLHAGLSEAEGARIVAAFRRQPIGKNTKDALAFAVAATRAPEAAQALVESLLSPDARRIRGAVSEALRRLDAPSSEKLLLTHLVDATPQQRAALVSALAVVGGKAAVADVRALLADGDASVRVEAAAALGGMARNARERDPEARLGVAGALAARITGAAAQSVSDDESRAVVWALAQLDEEAAVVALRAVAADASRPALRAWAARLIARPRQSLTFRS